MQSHKNKAAARKFYLAESKNMLVTQALARDFIPVQVGERIKTTTEFAQQLQVGQGTVQKALQLLEQNDVVRLEPRGHQGTYLIERNLSLLWEVSGYGTIGGVMPLPDSKELEGIATALVEIFQRADIPLNITHLPGSLRRIEHMKVGRADFVVLSRTAAQEACTHHPSLSIEVIGAPSSYYAEHSLVVLAADSIGTREQLRRVGIDRSSTDHMLITQREFQDTPVEFVDVPYHLIPDLILANEIDGATWHKTTRRIEALPVEGSGRKLHMFSLTSQPDTGSWSDLFAFTILTLNDNEPVKSVFKQIVDVHEVEIIQAEVISSRRVPHY